MKKIILVLAIISLASCRKSTDVIISQEEYNQLKNQDVNVYPKPFTYDDNDISDGDAGILLGSDGHEYLQTNNSFHSETFTHYVDCIKCPQRQQEFENRIIQAIHYKDSTK